MPLYRLYRQQLTELETDAELVARVERCAVKRDADGWTLETDAPCYAPIEGAIADAWRKVRERRIGRPLAAQWDGAGEPTAVTEQRPDADERELLAAAEDPQGWGDHVASLIRRIGADRAYKLLRKVAGAPTGCGACNRRRKSLNRLEAWVKQSFS